MTDPIHWYRSRTIQIGIAQIFGGLSGLALGYLNDDKDLMLGSLWGIITGVGTIWGRVVATNPIGKPRGEQ